MSTTTIAAGLATAMLMAAWAVAAKSDAAGDTPSSSAPAPSEKPWTRLFNGKDLEGWQVRCKPEDKDKMFWKVRDGVIFCDSMGQGKHNYVWLMTAAEYDDFELRLKVRGHAPQSKGNSGVQVRSRYDDEAGWLDGPQVDIHPPTPWRTGLIYDETRGTRRWICPSLKSSAINRNQAPAKYVWHDDDWNDIYIRCQGTKILTRVNGVVMADFDGKGVLDDEDHRKHNVGLKGHIALQLHTGDQLLIDYKDIEVRPLK